TGQGRPIAVVSPIVAGEALKGPAARLFSELADEAPSAVAVARYYRGIATHFVLDQQDSHLAPAIDALGYRVLVAQTVMTDDETRAALGKATCDFIGITHD